MVQDQDASGGEKLPIVDVVRAGPEYAADILSLIKELAAFEKMSEQVEITDKQIASDLEKGAVDGFVVRVNGAVVGMTLFYMAYSTWQGQYIHLEDIYVRPAYRRKGYGMRLWCEVAKVAQKKGMKRLQWNVLNWNENALKFYSKVKATNLTAEEGWMSMRLNDDGINSLANLS